MRLIKKKYLPQKLLPLQDLLRVTTRILRDEDFLLYENLNEDGISKITLFATKNNLHWLDMVYGRNLKVCPQIFVQVPTVHGLYRITAFPLVYCLLTNKEEESYTAVIREIRKFINANNIVLNPTTIISDFELSIVNAHRAFYPHADTCLCFLHLGQTMFRTIQDRELQQSYNNPDNRDV